MRKPRLAYLTVITLTLLALAPLFMVTHAHGAAAGSGVGNIPQGTQSNAAYASSFATQHVANEFVTTQQTSCYPPQVRSLVPIPPRLAATLAILPRLPCWSKITRSPTSASTPLTLTT